MSLVIRGLTKRYGSTLALDEVDLEVEPGQIHALLGHNGAGKSTLIGCLGGGTRPTAGSIRLSGQNITAAGPLGALKAGVAVIYQHLSLVETLTVSDNLFFKQEQRVAGTIIDRRRQHHESQKVLDSLGASARPSDLVRDLSLAQRQLVEIGRALLSKPRLIVFDEPTASLSKMEVDKLVVVIRALQHSGIAILYVTHLLSEVLRLADKATVLRGGRVAWSSDMKGITKSDLISAVSNGAQTDLTPISPVSSGERNLSVIGIASKTSHPVDFEVKKGEVLALYGLVGSGRTSLLELLAGARHRTAGTITVSGKPLPVGTTRRAIRAGVCLVPSDRHRQALFGSLSATDNVSIGILGRLARLGIRDRRRERFTFDEAVQLFRVYPPLPTAPVGNFSGGNQQKLVFGRWVNETSNVKVLLLDNPTEGVDVGARTEIYRTIRDIVARTGISIVLATDDPDELLALAHRCLIMRDGRIEAEYPRSELSEERLLELAHNEPTPNDWS
jgi:ABC-type sugar transport system ATPase subunit